MNSSEASLIPHSDNTYWLKQNLEEVSSNTSLHAVEFERHPFLATSSDDNIFTCTSSV
jgi:hypothetical protein